MSEDRDRYLLADDKRLLAECRVHLYRASGPGGQKRSKTSSAVRLRHEPTGLTVVATESRLQGENRARALRRLRMVMALKLRRSVHEDEGKLPQCLLQDYSGLGWTGISIKNAAYPLVVASVLDILAARDGRVSETAERLGISTARLVAFFRRDTKLWGQVNSIRQESGQRRLR